MASVNPEVLKRISEMLVQGDQRVLEAIIRVLGPLLIRRLKTRLGLRWEEAEDVFSEGVARLWKRRFRFDPKRGTVWGLLWRICWFHGLSELRKLERSAVKLYADLTTLPPPE